MTTAAEIATVPEINVIKGLSNAIWGSEWIVLDEYGDSEGVVDRDVANKLVEALHEVKKLPLDQLDDGEKLDALASLMAGQPVSLPAAPVPDVIVDLPVALPAWERLDLEEEAVTSSSGGPVLRPIKHGTVSGYQSHKNRGETPCDECRAGAQAYWRKDRAARARSAQPKAKKPATKARTNRNQRATSAPKPVPAITADIPASNGRAHDQLLEGLLGLLPATHETFTEEAKGRWIAFARLTLDIVWPNS